MTATEFLNYIQYSTICPERVAAVRWAGMIRWAITRGIINRSGDPNPVAGLAAYGIANGYWPELGIGLDKS